MKQGELIWCLRSHGCTFESDRDGNREIYVINADGTYQVRLTNNTATDMTPAWSPDGSKIAFRSYRDGNSEVYVMNTDGTNPVNLTNNPDNYDGDPAWSPDGSKILFSSWRGGCADLWVMNADGTGPLSLLVHVAGVVKGSGHQMVLKLRGSITLFRGRLIRLWERYG